MLLSTSCCYAASPGHVVADICGIAGKKIFLLQSVC